MKNEKILATKKQKCDSMEKNLLNFSLHTLFTHSGKLEQYDTANGGKIIYGQKDGHI
jgi:hypothetical protein